MLKYEGRSSGFLSLGQLLSPVSRRSVRRARSHSATEGFWVVQWHPRGTIAYTCRCDQAPFCVSAVRERVAQCALSNHCCLDHLGCFCKIIVQDTPNTSKETSEGRFFAGYGYAGERVYECAMDIASTIQPPSCSFRITAGVHEGIPVPLHAEFLSEAVCCRRQCAAGIRVETGNCNFCKDEHQEGSASGAPIRKR